jgi:hypothetical protein
VSAAARLEDLTPGMSVRGVTADGAVTVVAVRWHGSTAVTLTYRDDAGKVDERLVYRTDEPSLLVAEPGRAWGFDADGHLFRLVSEARRIRMAYLFDPMLAVHLSQLEALPHQIQAVYGAMLPRLPLRFLLADDPGAGKTIMAGLYIKELAHDLRHAHASWLLAGGADLATVKERMGHARLTTTEIYLHSLPHADAAAVAAIDNIRRRRGA